MSNLFTQIGDAALRQQEQLQRARLENQTTSDVQPSPVTQPRKQFPGSTSVSNTNNPPPSKNPNNKTTSVTNQKSSTKKQKKSTSEPLKPNGRTGKPNGQSERAKQSSSQNIQNLPSVLPTSISIDSLPQSVIGEMAEGANPNAKRTTERYSFEIYSDQKQLIRKLQTVYEDRTEKHLPKSRIIREALDAYLNSALKNAS